MSALDGLLARVLVLHACVGEPAELLRAFLAGDRSRSLSKRLCPETRPLDTQTEIVIWWALFAILHELLGDAIGMAEAVRCAEEELVLAEVFDGPATIRHPQAPAPLDRGRRRDVVAGHGWYYAFVRRFSNTREVLGRAGRTMYNMRATGWVVAGPAYYDRMDDALVDLGSQLLALGVDTYAHVAWRGPYATEQDALLSRDVDRPYDPCPAPAGVAEGC